MDFLKNVGNMVGKGFDSIKTNIYKTDNQNTNQPNNSLPKGVHILGEDEQTSLQQNNSNQNQTNINNNNKKDDYNKFYYGQQNPQQNPQVQNKPLSSSMRDLFNNNNNNNQQTQQIQQIQQKPPTKSPIIKKITETNIG